MAAGLRHSDLVRIAEGKLADATLLLSDGRYSSAFYLAGYAVEIGIKAIISKQFSSQTIPDLKFVSSIYTHNLDNLISVAGLRVALQEMESSDPVFATNWALTKRWSEGARYEVIDVYSAQTMLQAVGDREHGVLQWLMRHW